MARARIYYVVHANHMRVLKYLLLTAAEDLGLNERTGCPSGDPQRAAPATGALEDEYENR